MTRAGTLLRRLRRARSGVAMTEFALSLPILLMAGMWGTEEANLAITHMRLNQLAVHIADNASRIGDTSTLADRKIYESDINDLIYGAEMQSGLEISLYKHGRVIISSLQVDPDTGNQYIAWQRCKGDKSFASTFGDEGDGLSATIAGMGPAGEEVVASDGDAVIFVEISYDYQPLIGMGFATNETIHAIASFTVRDDRDLSQIYQRDAGNPDEIAECGTSSGSGGTSGSGSGGTGSSGGSTSGSSTGGWTSSTGGSTGGWTSSTGGSTGGWTSSTGGTTGGGTSSTGGTTGGWTSSTGGTTGGWTSSTGGTTGGGTTSTGGTTSGWPSSTGGTTSGWSSSTGGSTSGWPSSTGGSTSGP